MKKFLFLLFFCLMSAAMCQQAKADPNGSETFTVTIPSSTNVVLAGSASNFGVISSAKFGTADTTTYTVQLGDGSTSATSYIATNDSTAPAKQYTIGAAPVSGLSSTIITSKSSKPTLTLANSTNGMSIDIQLLDHGQTVAPKLGSGGTPVSFAVDLTGNSGAGALNIPVSSTVPFDSTTKKAGLDMAMGLDMSTVTITTAPAGAVSFSLTLTAVGL